MALTHYLPPSTISDLWHARFGHLRNRMVIGLPDVGVNKNKKGRQKKTRQHTDMYRSPHEAVHPGIYVDRRVRQHNSEGTVVYAGFEQHGVYRLVDFRAMDHYLFGDFEQQGVYEVQDSKAMDHYLSSSSSVADLGLVVHERHVPDEGDFAVAQRSVGEWLQEYMTVNSGLMSHACEDRASTQVRGMCYCLAQRLHRSAGEQQFYIHRENGLRKVIVDDLIDTDGGVDHIRFTLLSGQSESGMCDTGFGSWQVQRGIVTSQKQTELLVAFDVQNCKPSSSLMAVSRKLSAIYGDELMDASGHRKLGRSLIRLEISFPVGLLEGFMSQPKKTHWQAGFRLLWYLQATPDRGIRYAAGTTDDEEVQLKGWTDSDWAGDVDHRRSTTGYCFTLGSGAISWSKTLVGTHSRSL